MAKKQTARTATAPDPTWVGTYHDRDGEVELRAGEDGKVPIRDAREARVAIALGLDVTGDAPPPEQADTAMTEGDQPDIPQEA